MEYNGLNETCKQLIIGDFVISCVRSIPDRHAEIPFSGMAFYHPGEEASDFRFHIDSVNPDDKRILLYGSDDFMFPTFLYQEVTGAYDWITKKQDGTPALSFRISPDWTEFTLYDDQTDTKGERAFHEFGSLFSYAVLNHHACVLHGVVMEYEGKGILITAASGVGKTTHTRMWRDKERALILNGDRCLCRNIEGTWYAYGMPWSGSSGEYINRRVPIRAIVSLRQAPVNSVRSLSPYEGTIWLLQRIFAPVWKGNLQNQAFNMAEELAAEIPMLELSCTPDYEAVQVLKTALTERKILDSERTENRI